MEIRELGRDDEAEELSFDRLVSSCFGLSSGASYLDDFPIWRRDSGADHLKVGFFGGSELLACAAIRFARLRDGGAERPIGIIGAVATAAEARGRGYASALIAHLVVAAEKRGCLAAALFGSEVEFYARLGFLPAGKQFRAPLMDLITAPSVMEPGVFGIRSGWSNEVPELMRGRTLGLTTEACSEHWLPLHRNTEWRLAFDVHGRASAFAAIGRGIDLSGFVHDWAGSPAGLRAIFIALERDRPAHYQLLGPLGEYSRLGLPIGKALYDPLCLARPMNGGEALIESDRFWLWGLDGA